MTSKDTVAAGSVTMQLFQSLPEGTALMGASDVNFHKTRCIVLVFQRYVEVSDCYRGMMSGLGSGAPACWAPLISRNKATTTSKTYTISDISS